MAAVRTSISLTDELKEALLKCNFNVSAVCEAALWRAVRGETTETENRRLRETVKELEDRLERARKALSE
jgi:hypothetical protein